MILVAVYDTKAEAHLHIATLRTSAEAIRQFESVVKTPESQFNKNPSDYVLKQLADYDELTGQIIAYDIPKILS